MENLKIIRGGLTDTALTSKKTYVDGIITDTRLMGVVVVHAIWELPENLLKKELHQFFYFDAEEFGFDTYKSVLSAGPDDKEAQAEIRRNLDRMGGCLGGKYNHITEKELRYLVQHYTDFTLSMDDVLPEGYEEYKFLLKPRVGLIQSELRALLEKECTEIHSDYELINYFIMRTTGKDYTPLMLYKSPTLFANVFPEHKCAALIRNSIKYSDGSINERAKPNIPGIINDYLCESLIEYDNRFFILTSEIAILDEKVVRFERIGSFEITRREADMMRAENEEHAIVFEFKSEESVALFNQDSTELLSQSMMNEHENGKLYMIFNPDNSHVNKQTFHLAVDVLGSCLLTVENELVLVSRDSKKMLKLIEDFMRAPIYKELVPRHRFAFDKSILPSFIESGWPSYVKYVEFVTGSDLE